MKYSSVIIERDNGQACLYAFYNSRLRDWDAAIEAAYQKHGVAETRHMNVICRPAGQNTSFEGKRSTERASTPLEGQGA